MHRKTRDARKSDRIKAVLLYDKGCSLSQISEIIPKSERTLRRHIEEYHQAKKLECYK